MAGFAHIGSINMTVGQVMTTGAGTIDLIVVHPDHWGPGRGAMTGLADIGSVDMATGQTVATRAGAAADHLVVVHGDHRGPT